MTKWQKVEMRITPVVDMLGGMNSVEYQQLQILPQCLTIRKYSFFGLHLYIIYPTPSQYIVKYYGKKFI